MSFVVVDECDESGESGDLVGEGVVGESGCGEFAVDHQDERAFVEGDGYGEFGSPVLVVDALDRHCDNGILVVGYPDLVNGVGTPFVEGCE